METREIEAGTQILIAAPAHPMPAAQSAAIADMLAKVAGVEEAHLPYCFVPGAMSDPAQVLVLVLARGTQVEEVLHAVNCHLAQLLTEDSRLDIFPLTRESGMLKSVRAVGCQILGAKPNEKPWWKFW
ncbi:MAG: enhanced serine sensitivity protein SseB C-terminal domain-containing protein [Pyrinomonadaceae bacterium]